MQWLLFPREITLHRPLAALPTQRPAWISGAAFVVARGEFLDVGGFDAALFLYFEDYDLCRLYASRGLPIRGTDAVTVTHVGQGSSPRDENTMATYALLSLVQHIDKWEGSDVARDAAARSVRFLRVVELTGGALRGVPGLGPRAAKKRDSAFAIRSAMRKAAIKSPVAGAYGEACDAFRRAQIGRSRSDHQSDDED